MTTLEPTENYTYGDMLAALQALSPKQLLQNARWISESGQGKVAPLWVLEEDHIDPSGEGLEPVSGYLPAEGEEFNENEHMGAEELAAENLWPKGFVFISID
jgi:hypothetical protein